MNGLETPAASSPAASATSSAPAPTNPYNTRRKSLYFSPNTHSASFVETPSAPAAATASTKHPAHHPEHNPRSPKRVRRLVPIDRAFTPPPSPPNNSSTPTTTATSSSATTPASAVTVPALPTLPPSTHHVVVPDLPTPPVDYDEEDDPVINAIIHVLQLSDNCPLSTRDLSSSILEFRLCSLESPNPSSVVSSRITSHLKRRAAEKPPREPLLARYESENGRRSTAYHLKYPERVSERSPLYLDIKPVHSSEHLPAHRPPPKPLQSVPASKLNILSSDVLDMLDDEDEYDSEDISNRSPDRPTLFDPPNGIAMSPEYSILGGGMMDIDDVPTGIKLDYEFLEPDNLTPPSEEISLPNTPLQEGFSRRASPIAVDGTEEEEEVPSPAADEELPDDPQSPHSGGVPNVEQTSFFDFPLIYHSQHTEQAEQDAMYDGTGMEDDDDEVHIVALGAARTRGSSARVKGAATQEDSLLWTEKKDELASPEKVGMDELEEWLGEI